LVPDRPTTASRALGLVTERLAGEVDVQLRRREVAVTRAAISAAGEVPAAAAFVIDECRLLWNGLT